MQPRHSRPQIAPILHNNEPHHCDRSKGVGRAFLMQCTNSPHGRASRRARRGDRRRKCTTAPHWLCSLARSLDVVNIVANCAAKIPPATELRTPAKPSVRLQLQAHGWLLPGIRTTASHCATTTATSNERKFLALTRPPSSRMVLSQSRFTPHSCLSFRLF